METITKNKIIDMIKESRKAQYGENKIPKEITLNNNSNMILKLMKTLKTDNLDFIYENDKIDNFLIDKSISTKRNYYSVILSLLNYDKYIKKKDNQDIIIKYQNIINSFEAKKKDSEKKGIMNDKKTEKLDFTNEDMTKFMNILKKNGLEKEYVIMTILNQYPIRAEISNVVYIELKEYKALKKNKDFINDKNNYIVYGTKKIILSRGNYKTFDLYGRKETEINGQAKRILNKYIKSNDFYNGKSLFNMTNEELTKRLFYISNKYMNIPLSVNSIAKLTIRNKIDTMKKSNEYKKANTPQQTRMDKELIEDIADIRGTSFNIIWNSYVR